jgi:hypothetical protein
VPPDVEGREHGLDESQLPESSAHLLAGVVERRELANAWKFGLYRADPVKESSVVRADVSNDV